MLDEKKENLVIMDDIHWLTSFITNCFDEVGLDFFRLKSSIPMNQSYSRFCDVHRIVLHWESQHRSGGAILEELLELDPLFPIDERVIVLTTNPVNEDVYYFKELGVKKIVRVGQNKLGLMAAAPQIRAHLTSKDEGKKDAWARLHKAIDELSEDLEGKKLEAIDRAVEILRAHTNKISASYLDAKASIYDKRGEKQDAELSWLKAIEENQNYYRAWHNLTLFYEKEKRFEEAVTLIHKLNQRNKNSISRMVQLGRIHKKADDTGKAEHYYKLALEKDKYCSRALNGLAEIRFDEGQFDAVKDLLDRSQDTTSAASYLNQKGVLLVRKRRYKEALELYENAQFVLPNQEKGPMLFYNIGLCYSRWGKVDMAKEYLRLALIKNPKYKKANMLLSRLEGSASDAVL